MERSNHRIPLILGQDSLSLCSSKLVSSLKGTAHAGETYLVECLELDIRVGYVDPAVGLSPVGTAPTASLACAASSPASSLASSLRTLGQ